MTRSLLLTRHGFRMVVTQELRAYGVGVAWFYVGMVPA